MRIRVYVKLEHHTYARSSVDDTRVVVNEDFPDDTDLSDGWELVASIEVEGDPRWAIARSS